MTRAELKDQLLVLIPDRRVVEQIFFLFSKLTPEIGSGNIIDDKKAMVPKYNMEKIKRKKPRLKVKPEHAAKAKEILRAMGMI